METKPPSTKPKSQKLSHLYLKGRSFVLVFLLAKFPIGKRFLSGHARYVTNLTDSNSLVAFVSGMYRKCIQHFSKQPQKTLTEYTGSLNCVLNMQRKTQEKKQELSIRLWDLQGKVEALCFVHHCKVLPLVGHKPEWKDE